MAFIDLIIFSRKCRGGVQICQLKSKSNAKIIEQIEKTFQVWRPTYMGDSLGKLAHFKKKKIQTC